LRNAFGNIREVHAVFHASSRAAIPVPFIARVLFAVVRNDRGVCLIDGSAYQACRVYIVVMFASGEDEKLT